MITVVSYIRVSSKGQLDGDGPERQRDSISAFGNAHSLLDVQEFFEKGVSGTVDGFDRPALSALFDHLETRPSIRAVVIERMDRLARDLMVQEFTLAEFRKRGIAVYAADQGNLIDMAADGSDPTRTLIRQILGALSQWEKTMLVLKLKKARDRIKAATGKCGGAWRYDEKPEGRTLLAIFDNLDTGTLSLRGLARLLNDGGIRTFKGSIWRAPDVSDMRKRVKKLKENNLWHGRIVIQ